jgi:hypothetical protein
MIKLLVLCNTIKEYNQFIEDAALNRNTTRPIYRYEDVLGYNEPTKYVALSLPAYSGKIREYFMIHGITHYKEEL